MIGKALHKAERNPRVQVERLRYCLDNDVLNRSKRGKVNLIGDRLFAYNCASKEI